MFVVILESNEKHSAWNTREEAMTNIQEAIELYLEEVEDDVAPREGYEVQELTV